LLIAFVTTTFVIIWKDRDNILKETFRNYMFIRPSP